jgi:hypothetical protein
MKKIKLKVLGILLTITLVSCSNDGGSSSNTASLILPKKINYVENIDYGTVGQDSYLTYNGNKLVSVITDSHLKNVITYTGDLITKIESYDYDVIFKTVVYTYSNGKLDSRFIKNTGTQNLPSYITHYVFNSNGTVSCTSPYDSWTLTFANGNLVADQDGTYKYDTKNNPFKNILGINALSLDNDSELGWNISINNRIKGTGSSISTNTIIYNSDDYPTVDKEYYNNSTTGYSSNKYFY